MDIQGFPSRSDATTWEQWGRNRAGFSPYCGETNGVATNYIQGQDVDISREEKQSVDVDIQPAVKPADESSNLQPRLQAFDAITS